MRTALLLSGGIDSTAVAVWKPPDIAFTIDYGQVPVLGEIRASKKIAYELGIAHEVITVDCSHLGSGDLAGQPPVDRAPSPEWWPFRNQLLITIASIRAIELEVEKILVGAVSSDNIHADGRNEFFRKMDEVTRMQEGRIQISAPAINLSSSELIKVSGIEIPLLAWTHSCHKFEYSCGNCRGCLKHQTIFNMLLDETN